MNWIRSEAMSLTRRACAVACISLFFSNLQAEDPSHSSGPAPLSPQVFNPDPGGIGPDLPNPEIPPEEMPGLPELFERELIPVKPAPKPRFGLDPALGNTSRPRDSLELGETFHGAKHPPDYTNFYPETNPLFIFPDGFALPNRWKVNYGETRRYEDLSSEQPYMYGTPELFHPYRQSILKGDAPVIGQDIFLNLSATSFTEAEFRSVPTPSNISTSRPDSGEFFGRSEQIFVNQNFAFSIELFKGETAFKPVEWLIKITPVFNLNYIGVEETTIVSPDPRGPNYPDSSSPTISDSIVNPGDVRRPGLFNRSPSDDFAFTRYTERFKSFFALQEAFVEIHLADLTDNYDFISSRFGNQPFLSDFRGFLFTDTNLGFRFFGNLDDNRVQYNLAYFFMREKDTYSELNTFNNRDQHVIVANVFRQDFLVKGYTAQLSFHANVDNGELHYNRDGVIVRPNPIGSIQNHSVNACYFGWTGEGHFGRLNISHSFYQAFGHDKFNGIAGKPVEINAQMFALELSYDRDWLRPKAYVFYASGDDDATDDEATGFDSIIDNPFFAGAPFSYFARQGFGLGNTSVLQKTRGSLLNNLRSSKFEGQSNFVNPGTILLGAGIDVDITPKLRAQANINYIRFVNTDSVETALLQNDIDTEIGWDFSAGVFYRPLLTDNIIISAGVGFLVPGAGFEDIYRTNTLPVFGSRATDGHADDFYYSGLISVTLTY